MRDLFRRYKLPPYEFHPMIDGREVDFRIVGTNILDRVRRLDHARPRPPGVPG